MIQTGPPLPRPVRPRPSLIGKKSPPDSLGFQKKTPKPARWPAKEISLHINCLSAKITSVLCNCFGGNINCTSLINVLCVLCTCLNCNINCTSLIADPGDWFHLFSCLAPSKFLRVLTFSELRGLIFKLPEAEWPWQVCVIRKVCSLLPVKWATVITNIS